MTTDTRTNGEKRAAILAALRETPEVSNSALARELGVSDHTVARVRREREAAAAETSWPSSPIRRIRSNGVRRELAAAATETAMLATAGSPLDAPPVQSPSAESPERGETREEQGAAPLFLPNSAALLTRERQLTQRIAALGRAVAQLDRERAAAAIAGELGEPGAAAAYAEAERRRELAQLELAQLEFVRPDLAARRQAARVQEEAARRTEQLGERERLIEARAALYGELDDAMRDVVLPLIEQALALGGRLTSIDTTLGRHGTAEWDTATMITIGELLNRIRGPIARRGLPICPFMGAARG